MSDVGMFTSASRAKDKIGESFRLGNGCGNLKRARKRGSGVSDLGTVQLLVCTCDHHLDKGEALEGSRDSDQNQVSIYIGYTFENPC